MTTLSSGYEGQLSAMSDHLCELRDKLAKSEEELENAKKGKVRLFCLFLLCIFCAEKEIGSVSSMLLQHYNYFRHYF